MGRQFGRSSPCRQGDGFSHETCFGRGEFDAGRPERVRPGSCADGLLSLCLREEDEVCLR